MVRETKHVGFEPVFESLHSWSISYGGWDFIANLGAQCNALGEVCVFWVLLLLLLSLCINGPHQKRVGVL